MEIKITAIILTFNEEKNIPACLESLQGLPLNVFVVDSNSTDNTLKILEEWNIKYVTHAFENYSIQRNWAEDNNPFTCEWVLHLDADERLTPELRTWLSRDFINYKDADGFIFGRRAIFMGKWIRYGGHYNYHLRLYKANMGKCEDKVYDQHFVMTRGKAEVIRNKDISNVLAENLNAFISNHNRWAFLEAVEILKKNKTGDVRAKLLGTPIEKKRWLKNNLFQKSPLFIRSFIYFFYRYFFRFGFLDGRRGLIFHILQGFWFRFLVDAKVYEIKLKMKEENMDLSTVLEKEYSKTL